MIYAESQASRKFPGSFQWSPTLKKVVHTIRDYQLQVKQFKGIPVSNILVSRCCAVAFPDGPPTLSTLEDSTQHLKLAYHDLCTAQKTHHTLCQSYLEDLAEAIVSTQTPAFSQNSESPIKVTREAAAL